MPNLERDKKGKRINKQMFQHMIGKEAKQNNLLNIEDVLEEEIARKNTGKYRD